VPRVLEAAGLEPPATWEAYFAAARAVAGHSGGEIRGFGQRGTGAWHTMYTGFATQLWSCGGGDFEDGRCAIASPAAARATTDFLDALRDAGPADWPEQRWYELALDFAAGRYGLLVDSDHYVAYFEDPATSRLAGEIAYALPPTGPGGVRRPNLWTWSLVVNTRARDLDATWQFVEWASGRELLLRSAFEGNMNPTRKSTWDDERFRERVRAWGDFYGVARRLVEDEASVLVTPAPGYLGIAQRWVQALLDAYAGRAGVAEALELAARDLDRLVAS
jgi:multiple sugar transport system substrate-binding protein